MNNSISMKHAWLIIAHNEFGILQILVSMLDDARSDFYIHIDKKVKRLPEVHAAKGRIYILEDRVDVRWGTVSQIQTELVLLDAALRNGPYDYYHIISGTTLPLKPFEAIDTYFQSAQGKSVVTGFRKDEPYQEMLKIHRFNLFTRNFGSSNTFLRATSQFCWKAAIAVQRLLHITTNPEGSFYKAGNWLSLTEEAVRYLLSRKEAILKTYRYSFCGDEYFVPSELMAAPSLCGKIVNDDKYLKDDMGRSNAKTFHLSDYQELSKSRYLFARKFAA